MPIPQRVPLIVVAHNPPGLYRVAAKRVLCSSLLILTASTLVSSLFLEYARAQFVDATSGPLGDVDSGIGVAWGDFDNDGDLDLYLADAGTANNNNLLRNDGGGTFVDVTSVPLDNGGSGRTAVWGDYDNDGDLDLYLSNFGSANKLFRNDGGETFTDVTSAPLDDADIGRGAAWGDYDNDGDLDLYLANLDTANKLFRNEGDDTFVDATGGPLGDTGAGNGVTWGDFDNDGDLDLYLVNDNSANKLFRNEGGGTFADATAGPLGDAASGQGATWGDYDNDGDLDLYLSNFGTANKLFRNDGGGSFVDDTGGPLGDEDFGLGVAWGDYDNDGDLDLYLANVNTANKLFRNDGSGTFIDDTSAPLDDPGNGRGVAWGDIDDDGDLDLYLAIFGANKLFRNESAAAGNHWLQVELEGVVSNRSAIGARVRLVAGGVTQIREVSGGSGYLSQNSLPLEFGLGTSTTIDSLIIRWPSGIVQVLTSNPSKPGGEYPTTAISVDQVLEILESSDAPPQVEVLAPVAQSNFNPGETATILWNATDNAGVTSVDINYVPGLTLYGTTTSGPGNASSLFTINESTGAASLVGPTNFNNVGALAMSHASGILYAEAERPSDDEPILITIDRSTGAGTEIGPTGIAANITDLAFNRGSSVLFGHREITSGGSLTNLYIMDIATGTATLVGGTNQAGVGGGLEFSLPNRLFVALNSFMFSLNRSTGGALTPTPLVFSAPIDNSPQINALTIHPITGLYYGVATDADGDIQFVQINPGTGTVTNIGATQAGLDGLAFGPAAAITIANGEANDGSYSWTLPDSPGNDRRIQVIAHDNDGNSTSDMTDGYFNILTTTAAELSGAPQTTFLSAVAPNPFQSETTIRFGLAQSGIATLSIFDIRGRLVAVLLSGEQTAGYRSLRWNGRDRSGTQLASGNYILRLETNAGTYTRSISLIR